MAVAFTAYAFDSNVENEGHGIKLGLYCVQAARVAQRDVRESRHDENGNLQYDGNVIWMKGKAYLVNCNVTGSDEGTSTKPKFSLVDKRIRNGKIACMKTHEREKRKRVLKVKD
jgi:hypothetical protein